MLHASLVLSRQSHQRAVICRRGVHVLSDAMRAATIQRLCFSKHELPAATLLEHLLCCPSSCQDIIPDN